MKKGPVIQFSRYLLVTQPSRLGVILVDDELDDFDVTDEHGTMSYWDWVARSPCVAVTGSPVNCKHRS